MKSLSEHYRCFPIFGDVDFLAAMVKDGAEIGRLVLKGCEAAGFVSGETTLVLYSGGQGNAPRSRKASERAHLGRNLDA